MARTPGPHGYVAYRPRPLSRSTELHTDTVLLLSDADRALGRLAGAGRLLPYPHLLLQPYIVREALASSRIEGTQASLSDVFDAQARNRPHGPVREVTNYIQTLEYGLSRLTTLPVSRRLLCEVHEILMADVRGQERRPGEVRSSQNWIGSPDNRIETAVFVPPPVDDMQRSLGDLERFIHEDAPIPPLVKIALVHYQFETIHPFLDGNGRLGRLLIVFLRVEQGVLPQPLLYLSAYFERRRGDYYDRLQAVRERGELHEWLAFFLSGITEQATEVVDLVFQNPVLTTTRIAMALDTSLQSALNHVRRLESEACWPRFPASAADRSAGSAVRSTTCSSQTRHQPSPRRTLRDPPAPHDEMRTWSDHDDKKPSMPDTIIDRHSNRATTRSSSTSTSPAIDWDDPADIASRIAKQLTT